MRQPKVSPEGMPSILAATDKDAFQGFPGLRSFFLDTRYEASETVRESGSLIVRADASRWVWILKDPTFMTQLTVAAPTWDEVQLLAETLLLDDRAPWVADVWAMKRRKGR